jgi:Cu/Ag efflux protein CusF
MGGTGKGASLTTALLATALWLQAMHALAFADRSLAEAPRGAVLLAQAQESGTFRGVGIVTAVEPATGALTLDHEEIKGLMPAMEMMYNVKARALSADLRKGDKVEFSLDAKSYTILDVKVIERAK